jgi:hypothetical protein
MSTVMKEMGGPRAHAENGEVKVCEVHEKRMEESKDI